MALGDKWGSLMKGGGFGVDPGLFKDTPPEVYMQAAQNNVSQQLYNDMIAQQAQAQVQTQTGQANVNPTPHERARSLFLARLGGIRGAYKVKPEDFVWCHITSDMKTVHVFFVFGDQAGNTSEDSAMFPSDQLITQFRLLMP